MVAILAYIGFCVGVCIVTQVSLSIMRARRLRALARGEKP